MLGSMLKGVAWCSTLALATIGALTFVPDESWERFPSALAPTRAQLAEFGIAPIKYRTSVSAGEVALVEDEPTSYSSNLNTAIVPSDANSDSEPRSLVRVGGGRGSFSSASSSNFDAGALESPVSLAARQAESQARFSGTSTSTSAGDAAEVRAPLFEGESKASDAPFDPTHEIPEPSPVEDPSSFSPELFADNAPNSSDLNASESSSSAPVENPTTPIPLANDSSVLNSTSVPETSSSPQEPPAAAPLAPLAQQETQPAEVQDTSALAQNEIANPTPDVTTLSSDASVLQVPQTSPTLTPPTNPLATTSTSEAQVLINNSAATTDVLTVSANLERALNSVQTLKSNEQARDVLLTLNRIQRTQSGALAEGDQARLNEALDQLAYDAFYNPTRFILEAPRKTAPGETLASIAREYDVTPRLLASINGLNFEPDAPLPPGTSLKTVRGPVTAEASVGKKELLLRFNDIYAGRFKLGVPRQATTLRGTHLVESKLSNPACDAVDTSGATISIPGGSPDNPLGACWIGLSGGYGLQGTNRPELVGTIVPENGGFVFSNLEISQLDVLLPIGAAISFVD